MCDNAVEIIATTMTEVRPEIVDVEDILLIEATPEGIAALQAYDALDTLLGNWKPGDAKEDVIQAINALSAALQAIGGTVGIPPQALALIGVTLAALAIIMGIIQANSTASTEERASIKDATTATVKSYVPSYVESKRVEVLAATIDPAAVVNEIKGHWNKIVEAAAKFDPTYAKYKR